MYLYYGLWVREETGYEPKRAKRIRKAKDLSEVRREGLAGVSTVYCNLIAIFVLLLFRKYQGQCFDYIETHCIYDNILVVVHFQTNHHGFVLPNRTFLSLLNNIQYIYLFIICIFVYRRTFLINQSFCILCICKFTAYLFTHLKYFQIFKYTNNDTCLAGSVVTLKSRSTKYFEKFKKYSVQGRSQVFIGGEGEAGGI